MWINIAFPRNGTVVPIQVDDDVLRKTDLYGMRLGQEVDGALFGKQFKGYVFRLKGGSDKEGFPMVNGVLANARVSLLLARGATGFNTFRGRSGERRRKAIRGCIIGPDIAMINVVMVKKGDAEIDGLTNKTLPRRLGPKRASKIRQLFSLRRDDDVRKYVVRRKVEKAGKKSRFKAPKVQRLITPVVKARRLKKLKTQKASLERSQQERREFLKSVGRARMVHRQRESSRRARQHLHYDIRDSIKIQQLKKPGAKTEKKAKTAKTAKK
jgi:small subunit ribosomal protein S6e